jgi:hypothetical protein
MGITMGSKINKNVPVIECIRSCIEVAKISVMLFCITLSLYQNIAEKQKSGTRFSPAKENWVRKFDHQKTA